MNRHIQTDRAIVSFDYFGLSHSADVKKHQRKGFSFYTCFLHGTGEEINIAFEQQNDMELWMDLDRDASTPLSQMLGQAIENQLSSEMRDGLLS